MTVDCHIHLFQSRVRVDRSDFILKDSAFAALYSTPKARISTPDQIIDYLDENSISVAVVFGFPWKDPDLYRENNDAVLEFSLRYSDRIIPFATFGLNNPQEACVETERTLSSGFRGLGELSMYDTGWDRTSLKSLQECLNIASGHESPVMLHVNEPVGHHYPGKIYTDFDGLIKLIGQNPRVDFILAHFGGGIFFYALMPEIGAILSRTYLDTAAAPFIYDTRIYEMCMRVLGENNILFGSDYPLLGLARYQRDIDKSLLTPEQKEKLLHVNASRLLGLVTAD